MALTVRKVRMLSDRTESVGDYMYEKTLSYAGATRAQHDQVAHARAHSDSSLQAIQAWSAENNFSDADRMTLAAHFVQQALDRNDVCHVRSARTAA